MLSPKPSICGELLWQSWPVENLSSKTIVLANGDWSDQGLGCESGSSKVGDRAAVLDIPDLGFGLES